MKCTKYGLDNLGVVFYRRFICNYGLSSATRITKEILRLLKAEKKRRKGLK